MKKEKITKPRKKKITPEAGCLPLLPLKNIAMLPKSILPVIVGRDISVKAVEHALKTDRMLFVSAQKNASTENPQQDDLFAHGTRAIILQVMRAPNGPLKILVEGLCRAKAITFESHENGFIQVQ